MASGRHFAALEQPELMLADLRAETRVYAVELKSGTQSIESRATDRKFCKTSEEDARSQTSFSSMVGAGARRRRICQVGPGTLTTTSGMMVTP